MIDVEGKYTTAVVYAKNIDDSCREQIVDMCNNPAFEFATIRIMPDCHAGKGCTIGTTIITNNSHFSPELVGVDIGCGVVANIISNKTNKINEQSLIENDQKIRELIGGKFGKISLHPADKKWLAEVISDIKCLQGCSKDAIDCVISQMGSLGSGNHFLEFSRSESRSEDNSKFALIVHTGSRALGQIVCNYYTEKFNNNVEGWFNDYTHDMLLVQQYASMNREIISREVLKLFGIGENDLIDTVESVHNYVEISDMGYIIRKGAIAARPDQKVVIPFNMQYGTMIGIARENVDWTEWNYSLPHGAGRAMSRKEAKNKINLEKYKQDMQGIISSSVTNKSIDEAPDAYKKPYDVIDNFGHMIEDVEMFKPVYSFKN